MIRESSTMRCEVNNDLITISNRIITSYARPIALKLTLEEYLKREVGDTSSYLFYNREDVNKFIALLEQHRDMLWKEPDVK